MPCCAVARSAPAVRSAILSPPEPAALPSGPSSDPLSSMSCALKLLTLQTLRLERCCCSSRAAHTCSANSRPPIVQQPPQQQQQRARRRSTAPRALATGPAASAMDPEVEMTVEKIHSSRARIVLYMAGGGSQVGRSAPPPPPPLPLCTLRPSSSQSSPPSPPYSPLMQAVSWLLSVPGASRTVLDVRVPYSRTSMAEVLGAPPANYASPGVCVCLYACGECGGGGGGGGGGGREDGHVLWEIWGRCHRRPLYSPHHPASLPPTPTSPPTLPTPPPQRRRWPWPEPHTVRPPSCRRLVPISWAWAAPPRLPRTERRRGSTRRLWRPTAGHRSAGGGGGGRLCKL